MKLAFGTIASMVLTVGALLVLVAVSSSDNVLNNGRRPPKTSYLRSGSSRKLYNYSRNSNNGYNGYSGGNSGGNYGGNYGGNNNAGNYNNNGGDGGNYANYDNNDGYNSYNYGYEHDDDDNYGNDDASYYNSNKNYQADGSSYNGRDQEWGGQSVQSYGDDEEPEVEVEEYGDEDEKWILGKFGGLSGTETLAVAGLAAMLSVSALIVMMLCAGINIIDLWRLHCCGKKNEKLGESVEDGFVKLGDY